MNKEELFNLLEKNLKDFENSKLESVKPNGKALAMGNFEFFCMCYMPLADKIRNDRDFKKKDEKRLAELDKEYERIKAMPFIVMKFNDDTNDIEYKKINF